MVKTTSRPSKEEWGRHMLNHMPFRHWCPYCVPGRAVEDQHYKTDDTQMDEGCPVVSLDYCYVKERVHKRYEAKPEVLRKRMNTR